MLLDSKIPEGSLSEKWDKYRFDTKLINPANKRKFKVIVVGTGLAGASSASSLAELGYDVHSFCFQDSPRRAHSIAAQGGINASKNYTNDGDSVYRLFYDTIKGGDYRSREANVYRLAQMSSNIIDQCVAQGVPFARDYGGLLDNRSFGGAQVSRTFYARGQTGQQLLLGAYSALSKQIGLGQIKMHVRKEMLDVVKVDGKARGIIVRDLVTGKLEKHSAHVIILATGGYGNVFYLSTNAMGSNVTAAWRVHKRGAFMANPCFTQIHPTCIPVSGEHQSKLTLMSESLRNDGRVWVPKKKDDNRSPENIPEEERYYYLEEKYPSFGNLVPRDVASRNAKIVCDKGLGVGKSKLAVYLDFKDAISKYGEDRIREKYGNLFHMYQEITNENPYQRPMRIYPAVHYTMGGLWVDYDLMTTLPGCYALGEANFSDHGANRLGASALMQGLADGYFVIPYTLGNYLTTEKLEKINTTHPAFDLTRKEASNRNQKILDVKGDLSPTEIHRKLGQLLWEHCGMTRNAEGLKKALEEIPKIKDEFWSRVSVPENDKGMAPTLEHAGRLADFIEFAETMVLDALHREESCGGHFREESQSEEGEAKRDDKNFSHVSAWEYKGNSTKPSLHKEKLKFENVSLTTRSYK